MSWAEGVSAMDAALFDEFGEAAIINGQSVQVIPVTSLDSFSGMAGNVTALSVPYVNGSSLKKGDVITYKGCDRRIATMPDHSDGLVSFELV